MCAVVGWLALCVERTAVAVNIPPSAGQSYKVSAHFDAEQTEGIILRAPLGGELGPVMRTLVEPTRPS